MVRPPLASDSASDQQNTFLGRAILPLSHGCVIALGEAAATQLPFVGKGGKDAARAKSTVQVQP
jgi:hypothetical protein